MLTRITTPLVEVLHSAGTSTVGFYESVSRAEKALTELGVRGPQARNVGERLKSLGKQIRGPEDFPVQ